MEDSILTSIKKLLGVEEEYTHFDTDIKIFINTALMVINQLGVGPPEGFSIQDKGNTWEEFFAGRTDLDAIKSFIYLHVKQTFDPPQMGYLVTAIADQLKELGFRINIQAESKITSI